MSNKIIIGVDKGSYTFSAATREVTISGITTVELNQFLLIINTTSNQVIYSPVKLNFGGELTGYVLTLDYDTTSMDNTDELQIYFALDNSTDIHNVQIYDASTANMEQALGAKSDTAATTDTGTFSVIAFFKRLLQKFTTAQTSLDTLALKANLSTNNNYNSTVGAGVTISGIAEDVDGQVAIVCALLSTQNGILYMEFSTDGITWQSSIPFNVVANTNEVHRFTRTRRYFRFRFTNTSVSSADVSIQTSFGSFTQLTSALNSVIQQDADANVARVIDTETLIGGSFLDGFSVTQKAGYNPDIDTGSIPEDICGTGGTYAGFPDSTLETITVVSSSILDTALGTGARSVTIIGLDTDYNVQQETITLNGMLGATSANQYRRMHTAFVVTTGSGGVNAGTLTFRHTVAITNIFATMQIGVNQTNESAFTVPAGFTGYIDIINVSISQGTAAAQARGYIWTRGFGMPFRARRPFVVSNTDRLTEKIYGRVRFSEKSDIVLRIASVSNNNTEVVGGYDIILIRN